MARKRRSSDAAASPADQATLGLPPAAEPEDASGSKPVAATEPATEAAEPESAPRQGLEPAYAGSGEPRETSAVAGFFAGIAWFLLAAVLALGGAGLVGQLTHPPGGPSREELTYAGDHALALRLDDASNRLREISANIDMMSSDAKAALEALATTDIATLNKELAHGEGIATIINEETKDLRNSLAGLPGDGPNAALQFSNATLVRRAEILAALDSALGLADEWSKVTGRSVDAARLEGLLQDHDATVAAAAALGVDARYEDALTKLQQAKITLEDIDSLRAELITTSDTTVLDAWVASHQRYDDALIGLYTALQKSGGKNSLEVQAAVREEKLARALLPSDDREIVVIVGEVAKGGLDQAVVAIEDTSGRIDRALAEASPS